MSLVTHSGFPRIGLKRELKRALEAHWRGDTDARALKDAARTLRLRHWQLAHAAGADVVPCNDFSLYDHVLDTAVLFDAIPERYRPVFAENALDGYFAMARGHKRGGHDLHALEMTKWFDTNYHYLVPELQAGQHFALNGDKPLAEFREARSLGLHARPVLLGPVSFLLLSKTVDGSDRLALLDALLPPYADLLGQLADAGADWVQLDEPCLVLDLEDVDRAAYRHAYATLAAARTPRLLLASYFGALGDNLAMAAALPADGLHVDLVRAPEQLDAVLDALPADRILSAGVVDGRNIWRSHPGRVLPLLRKARARIGDERLWLAPSCSLLHVPIDLEAETGLDPQRRASMAFARQKIEELRVYADALAGQPEADAALAAQQGLLDAQANAPGVVVAGVRGRLHALGPQACLRRSAHAVRRASQAEVLDLPPLPTTTIGSFPQTDDLRKARAAHRAGKLDDEAYEQRLRAEIERVVRFQERLGLDVLVHGEPERNDMVEYFGEQLDGYLFTRLGWVQSYGSRCVKPPVIWGDVARPAPMTVRWSRYAQSLTDKPMKGMLTGPVTMLQWSFVRDDLPRETVCRQIALALRDEVHDLEAAGIGLIQIDEPALREGLPLRRADWPGYLAWAVECFRIAAGGVRDTTQIHTHMCYSEFNDIIEAVAAMDADVISIETSRSRMELLDAFARFRYPNGIGPGVYDIHSPRVPGQEEILDLLHKALDVLQPGQLWINPDCGLKTRGWPEVEQALRHMVDGARQLRAELEAIPG
ncbi:5-methyltetrahydropteroyltriglutamate--homocysteine S-methyltransferase [Rhodanobacter denitrificans]|uniref:5-methyltetrahydropteroyltriglutamate-- homocysteine S-methyltransferase n=1 Tax=Rhodanobacter TaxID=75309 RepID=UPI000260FEFA|nr:5-methyltetrahydropteroyltriglutamate--homocysteine S-methyltransferase [Rhodanobacter denitrificans]EIM03553.1 5-methyltetrahydropteroyltriglutamate--homocysteine S-methyltransferase [Rhodanobacter denitrificans]UJM91230.1 5-methyltetrahydropteroyltriglutamate--homocysteine S-methyltransferase [Rhodanobacter denitrificans]